MLGLNTVRYFSGIRVRRFTVILGVLALAGGVGNFAGVEPELPLFSIFLILSGLSIMFKPFLDSGR